MNPENYYILPSLRYKKKVTVFSLVSVVVVGTCIYMGFDPTMLFTEFHYVVDLTQRMAPPHFELFWTNKTIFFSVLETISMAFLGSVFGGVLAILLAFLSAVNTMPLKAVRVLIGFSLMMLRVIPALLVILVFVVAVGLGAFAGMLTLVVGTIGTFGQLFTGIIENTESAPAEAITAVGASRMQVIRYVILPQVLPSFITNFFYSFDFNLRAAIGLGIFGGGGVGFELFMAMRILHYQDALALMCLIVLLIVLSERLSNFLRDKILSVGILK